MSLDVNKMTKDQLRQHIFMLAMELTQLEKENKKLKNLKILWKTVEERIEIDKGVVREED